MVRIDLDTNVRPFFQVLVKKVSKPVTAKLFFENFKRLLTARSTSGTKNEFTILQPTKTSEIKEDDYFAAHIRHSQLPTWYKSEDDATLSFDRKKYPVNEEHDLVIFYKKDDYVFVYTNCETIFSLIKEVQNDFYESDSIRFSKLTGDQMAHILNQFQIEYRSLGIQNHFGLGGTAPDGKTYNGKDMSESLTPSFDSGYGFSYCIGAMIQGDRRQPFGCSKNKSKVWSTWIENLDVLRDRCDEIVKWLGMPASTNNQLDVLVQSTSKSVIPSLTVVEFFLSYYIPEKGLLLLGVSDNEYSPDWICVYDEATSTIKFEVKVGDVLLDTIIKVEYFTIDEKYSFEYEYGSMPLDMIITDDVGSDKRRLKKDLVDFLNEQNHFTILYDGPYSYRDDECWKDNRLARIFNHYRNSIDWVNVDIRKEDLPASPGKINILQAVDQYYQAGGSLIFACNDNGANEVADYIALFEDRIILIHAKYASDDTPKLVIGDIQVVASQVIKNVRFFNRQAYTDAVLERIYKNATYKGRFATSADFKTRFLKLLSDKDTIKECMIVQPGISVKALQANSSHKMHSILNFVDSVLRVNNIQFQLVASA